MKRINKLRKLANIFPNNSSNDVHEDESLAYYHNKRDLEDNNLTTPPSDENIRIPSIWAFEIYTPATISNLYNGIKNLGLSYDTFRIDSDYEEFISNLRFRASGGGWINLGIIYDESIKTLLPVKTTKLPKGILSIRLSVLQYLPSTTFLTCQFFFDEETANSLNEPISCEYSTYTEKITSGLRFIDVPHQKKIQTDTMRAYLRNLCTSWIVESMPGYFSSKPSQNTFPTCELILLNKQKPLDKIGDRLGRSFLSILDLDKEHNAWCSDSINGIYLYLTESSRDQTNNIVLSGNIDEILSNEDLSMFGSDSKEKKILNWFSFFDHTFGILVLRFITREYEKQLGRFRDKYGDINTNDISRSIKQIQNIDKQFIEIQTGIIHFSHELKNMCKNKGYFMNEVYEFRRVRKYSEHDLNLFESIREQLIFLSDLIELNTKHIMTSVNIMRQSISAISSTELARINLKLQKGIYWMTGALILLTIVLVFMEFNSSNNIKNIITFLIEFIQEHIIG